MIVRSPRHSDGTKPMCFFPVHPIKTYVFPWPVPGVQNPCQDQTWTCHLLQMYRVRGLIFSPKEKIRFSKLGWESARWGTAFLHSPTLPVLILLLGGKGKEAAFLKPHTSRTFSRVCCEVTPSGSCRQYSDGSRRKQKRETVLKSHEHPTRETKDETKRTGKVERLKDNQRGLSVVIYNRDCKMVN